MLARSHQLQGVFGLLKPLLHVHILICFVFVCQNHGVHVNMSKEMLLIWERKSLLASANVHDSLPWCSTWIEIHLCNCTLKDVFVLQVVTKFIDKSKIPEEYWLADPSGDGAHRSPMEAALLSTLSHHNIVAVLDVFDNDACVQVLYITYIREDVWNWRQKCTVVDG